MSIVGIDLGTTNSVLSILQEEQPKTILIDNAKLLPSAVTFSEGKFIVGQIAKNMAILEPENTVLSIKRKMGEDTAVPIGGQQMRPEEISGLILKKIKAIAVELLGLSEGEELRAVITVPAYFTEVQRDATKQAAQLAGIKAERIINEPTAAALSFGLSKMEEAVYAVYDFGGGTFDVSIIESDEGLIEVLASTGNNRLGGDDLDHILADYIWKMFVIKNDLKNIQPTAKENARLLRIAEQTKIKLSTQKEVDIQESFFFQKDSVNYHLEFSIDRIKFQELIEDKIDETIKHLEQAISEAELTVDEIDGIILVGGSSRIPYISEKIEAKLGISPMLIDLPDEAVSHGATIQGAIIDGIDLDTILVDITPHSLGIAAMDDVSYQTRMNMFFGGGGFDGKTNLAAVPIISKNTPVPVKKTSRFSAVVPHQEKYLIEVFQGEESRFSDNKKLGEVLFELQKPMEDGGIEVTFELDLNGLLKMSAKEVSTGEETKATFKSSRGQKIKKSILDNALISNLDESESTLLRRAEKLFKEATLNEEDKQELDGLIEKYKSEQVENKTEELKQTESELLDLLYYLESNAN